MRILIVDDEPLARARLRAQIGDLHAGEVVGEAANGVEAIEVARACVPDVVLLDIRMPRMDGLEAARHLAQLPQPPAIIFATAYNDHALAAFDASAIDYIVKPIRSERLGQALARVSTWSQARADRAAGDAPERTHLSALVKGELRLIAVADIRYLRADQKYVGIGWPGGELLVEDSLRALEDEFSTRFLRVHRNALVAVAFITGIERDADGNHAVVLHGVTTRMQISRRLLTQVRKRLRT